LRLALLPFVPSSQLGQFTIPGTLRIQAQDASTFRIRKCNGPFLPLPLVFPLVLQDIGHDEEGQQSYGSEDWPAALKIDVVKETEETSREKAKKSDAMRSPFATLKRPSSKTYYGLCR